MAFVILDTDQTWSAWLGGFARRFSSDERTMRNAAQGWPPLGFQVRRKKKRALDKRPPGFLLNPEGILAVPSGIFQIGINEFPRRASKHCRFQSFPPVVSSNIRLK